MTPLNSIRIGGASHMDIIARFEAWAGKVFGPTLKDTEVVILADLKAAATEAAVIADTLAGPILAVGATAVNAAATTAFTAYLGPAGGVASLAERDAIYRFRDQLKAEIDSAALAFEASMAAKPAAGLGQSVASVQTIAGSIPPQDASVAATLAQNG